MILFIWFFSWNAAVYHAVAIDTKAGLTRRNVVSIAHPRDKAEMKQVPGYGGGDEILFERTGKAGVITLTRPKALNALTRNMVIAMSRALADWEHDAGVEVVIVRGEGRAFCAGGDIQAIYDAGKSGHPLYSFFADEYRLNIRIESYPKPYVALVDGIVMGGGVGISIHGSHRVFSEKAKFAMPEVTIGFFPDVGGSRFLPRLPGEFGLWLGLTGSRLGWGDAKWAGLATHCAKADQFERIVADLAGVGTVDAVLGDHSFDPERNVNESTVADIGRHFSAPGLAGLVKSLRGKARGGDRFAVDTLARLARASPTSLNVAFRQIRAGARLSMAECMAMEYRIASRMLERHDFYEGIRSAVIDKDGSPCWRPAEFDLVDRTEIDSYFASLGGNELTVSASIEGARAR